MLRSIKRIRFDRFEGLWNNSWEIFIQCSEVINPLKIKIKLKNFEQNYKLFQLIRLFLLLSLSERQIIHATYRNNLQLLNLIILHHRISTFSVTNSNDHATKTKNTFLSSSHNSPNKIFPRDLSKKIHITILFPGTKPTLLLFYPLVTQLSYVLYSSPPCRESTLRAFVCSSSSFFLSLFPFSRSRSRLSSRRRNFAINSPGIPPRDYPWRHRFSVHDWMDDLGGIPRGGARGLREEKSRERLNRGTGGGREGGLPFLQEIQCAFWTGAAYVETRLRIIMAK